MSGAESAPPVKRVGVELLKEGSKHLRGTIKETLEGDASHFSEDEYNLLKFHGVYQQDNRDERLKARAEKRDREWIMMIRAKIPGGELTADQYLAFDDIASTYANNTLRVTTRQCFQLHYVGKGNLKKTIKSMNDALVTTLGACGDVERNLVACPAPYDRAVLVRSSTLRAPAQRSHPANHQGLSRDLDGWRENHLHRTGS